MFEGAGAFVKPPSELRLPKGMVRVHAERPRGVQCPVRVVQNLTGQGHQIRAAGSDDFRPPLQPPR